MYLCTSVDQFDESHLQGWYHATEEILMNNSVLATLSVQGITDKMVGTYTLMATNAGGTLEVTFELVKPTGAPSGGELSPGEIAGITVVVIIMASALGAVAYVYYFHYKNRLYSRFDTRGPHRGTETAEGPILQTGDQEEHDEEGVESAGLNAQPKSYGATNTPSDYQPQQSQQPQIV